MPVEISGLQKNWKERVQPQTSTQRSSTTPSHSNSGDELNDQAAPNVQVIQKKRQTTAKVNMPGERNHQDGTKTVLFNSCCGLQTLTKHFSQG